MNSDLQNLSAFDKKSGLVNVVVEAPKGSNVKFKFEKNLGLFKLDKVLPLGASFPFDYGFIPSTQGADGDQCVCIGAACSVLADDSNPSLCPSVRWPKTSSARGTVVKAPMPSKAQPRVLRVSEERRPAKSKPTPA